MNLSDKMDTIYKNHLKVQRDPEEFTKVAETMFQYVSEKLVQKVENRQIFMSGMFGGGRPYVRTDIYIDSGAAFPKNHIEIVSENTVMVNSIRREGKMLFRKIKKLANKEGIKCFTGSKNIGFEYYLKG